MTEKRPLTVSKVLSGLLGRICVPGDKSISHRALMLAALANGMTRISGLLEGEDVLCTARAVEALGAVVARNADMWVVEGCGAHGLKEPGDVLDMGNSGTAARLLAGILASHPVMAVMTGDDSLRQRPMGRVSVPLAQTGARFMTREGRRLPMAIQGSGNGKGFTYRLPVASAQVKSAILLAGLNCVGETVLEEPVPTRDHTENMLRHFGVAVEVSELGGGGRRISLNGPAQLTARDVIVPGDPSSAAFPLVAALLVPDSDIVIENVGLNPLRAGLFTTLLEMGASLEISDERISGGETVGDLHVKFSCLNAVDVPPERAPSMIDEYPVLAVACACARGQSRLRGLGELRVKESDRLAATVALLAANGVGVEVQGDDLVIQGRECVPGGGTVETHMDHRLAMSAVVLGLVAREPVHIDDTAFIETSFPGFITLMDQLGAGLSMSLKKLVIAVDGPAAAGKGTLARSLAEYLGLPYLDTGLLYRAVACRALEAGSDLTSAGQLREHAQALRPFDLERPDLRSTAVEGVVSLVARQASVREVLLDWQRNFAKEQGGVLDGRDIGTVVFPEADVKLFVTASPEVRAQRRYCQRYGHPCTDPERLVAEVKALSERDSQDESRDVAPLRPAEDAVHVITDTMSAEEVFNAVCCLLQERNLPG